MANCKSWQEVLSSVQREREHNKRFQYTNSTAIKYKTFCKNNNLVAYPATAKSVGSYVCSFVLNLKGSTKSLSNVVSSIKIYGQSKGYNDWLDESNLYALDQIRKTLQYWDTAPVKRKKAMTLDIVVKIISCLNLNKPEEFLWALCLLLGHNGLLRSGELFSGLQVKHILWDLVDSNFVLEVSRSKVNRRNGPEYIRYQDYEGISAYKLLYKWFDTYNLWNQPEAFIIPFIEPRRGKNKNKIIFDFNRNGSIEWWRKRSIPHLVQLVGLDPSQYSGHSLRAGGATDLFTARVPYNIIKKYGRWKSDAALKYYRDDLDVANSVSLAFGRASMNYSLISHHQQRGC